MPRIDVEPWIPPTEPSLGRLAMEAADAEGLRELRAWPDVRGNGVVFGDLPPFLCWTGSEDGRHHLVLLQARELGALVPGARMIDLPEGWLRELDLESLARPLRRHPAFPGGASVQVVRVRKAGEADLRSAGTAPAAILLAVLARLTGVVDWRVVEAPPLAGDQADS